MAHPPLSCRNTHPAPRRYEVLLGLMLLVSASVPAQTQMSTANGARLAHPNRQSDVLCV